jgi:antirestriction protein
MSKKYNKIIRDSENYKDEVDSETQFRDELVKREKLMREQEKKNPIKSKFGDYNERITKDMDKRKERNE